MNRSKPKTISLLWRPPNDPESLCWDYPRHEILRFVAGLEIGKPNQREPWLGCLAFIAAVCLRLRRGDVVVVTITLMEVRHLRTPINTSLKSL